MELRILKVIFKECEVIFIGYHHTPYYRGCDQAMKAIDFVVWMAEVVLQHGDGP